MTTMFIGCATDQAFVEPTCAMLSSLDDNGGVPEATVLVAGFGLMTKDRQALQASAGRLGPTIRFIDIEPASPKIVALPTFSFPLPLLGRLILPREIKDRNARLLLIDSDMIVNWSVRPLFNMEMRGHPLAAILDPLADHKLKELGRTSNPTYFNAGLTVLDLDVFNERDIGAAAMRRLAAYPERPLWLDQDALNDVLGGDWLRLDRTWNFFHAGDPVHFTQEDYEAASIIHFAGPKPWNFPQHSAAPIYFRHVAEAMRKGAWRLVIDRVPVDRDFIATAYEVLLGRELDSEDVIRDRSHWPATDVLRSVLGSDEFARSVVQPIRAGEPLPDHLFQHRLSLRHRYWIQDRLPTLPQTALKVERAATWREVLSSLLEDTRFAYFLS